MSNNTSLSPNRKKLIAYLTLLVATFAVYWQVNEFDFIKFDDIFYVSGNSNIQSGITPDGIRWAFSIKNFGWDPLTFVSLMFDYQIYSLNAGGYHITNLVFHTLSVLLLFWLFHRMTHEIWKSAFVAALFALHPLHVESVAWIAERKDVLSAFFCMLTLCLYVYYAEKPSIGRYLSAFLCFILALMSKPMVVTLPVIMILLDYWPLKRFESHKNNLIPWQLKEKTPFFILSAMSSIITLFARTTTVNKLQITLTSRLANAPVAFVTYLGKTFWPDNLAFLYPFTEHIPWGQVWGALLLITAVSIVVIAKVKSQPYLFAGWFWFIITIAPVIGIIQISVLTPYSMADRYHYLPSIGLAVMLAWGIPHLFPKEDVRKKILFPAGILFIAILSFITWKQCDCWRDSITLFDHASKVTNNNYVAHINLGFLLNKEGRINEAIRHYSEAISIKPDFADTYYDRGNAFSKLGQYQLAVNDYNKAVQLKPDFAEIYNNMGCAYAALGRYQPAIENLGKAILLKPNAKYYNNRALAYLTQGKNKFACSDMQKACNLGSCQMLNTAKGKGNCR